MAKFDYTVETKKSFDDAVAAVEAKSREKGFGVLHVHDVKATPAVLIPSALMGLMSVAGTVCIHEGSELLAVANGLRMAKVRG